MDSPYHDRDLTNLGADIGRLNTEGSVSRFIHVEDSMRDLERLKSSVDGLCKDLEVRGVFFKVECESNVIVGHATGHHLEDKCGPRCRGKSHIGEGRGRR